MKYLFIGLGSIGMRHLKNLRSLTDEPIYALRTKIDTELDKQYNITSMTSVKEAMALKPDVVFITNPTSKHMSYALMFCDCHLFIEKPISTNSVDVAHLLAIMEANNKVCFVGYNYRFHPNVKSYHCDIGKVLYAQIQFGKWLPDWHPDEDYTKSYSARKEMGGGAVLALSHAIDYACWLFGDIKSVYAQTSKVSSLDIDVEDIASIILETRSRAIIEIHLDYLHSSFIHSIKVVYDNGTLENDLTDLKIRDETFVDEMAHFLNCVKGIEKPIISHKDIISVMRIIDAIRESSRTGRKVYL